MIALILNKAPMVQSDKTSRCLSMHSPVALKYQKQSIHILRCPFTRRWTGWFKDCYINTFSTGLLWNSSDTAFSNSIVLSNL